MIIYPAIDIRNEKCVRLYQGNFSLEKVYSVDPLSVAKKFVDGGASWIHIVDLNGADDPFCNQLVLISQIVKNTSAKIQTGGGIRTKHQVEALLNMGVERVIIGSMAIQQPDEIATWLSDFGPDRLVLALDIVYNRNNQPMITSNAWKNISEYSLFEMIQYYESKKLKHVLCTNISLDGTLEGPDNKLYTELIQKFPFICLQASGGIHSINDVATLKKQGLSGAIVGKALYENKFTLAEVLSC